MGNVTVSPPSSPQDTVVPAGCNIVTAVDCFVLDDRGRPFQECDDIRDPRSDTCTDNLQATGVAFRLLGNDPAFIRVSGGRTGTAFQGPISPGGTFRADGDFRGNAEIEIFTIEADGSPGDELEVLNINLDCDESSPLTLTTTFGPLELVGYQNAIGYFSSIKTVQMDYYIGNDSSDPLTVQSGIISSEFRDPFDVVGNDVNLDGNEEPLRWPFTPDLYNLVFTERQPVDFGAKYRDNEQLSFSLEATGVSGGLDCSDTSTYVF